MCSSEPAALTVAVPNVEDINPRTLSWNDVGAPELVLLTVKKEEFQGCYAYLKNVAKSYNTDLGWVYFGELVGVENRGKVSVSLVQCYQGAANPGAASTAVQNAVRILNPRALVCVGYCGGLNLEKVKLGDVVLSAKLAMYSNTKVTSSGVEVRSTITNVSRNMKKLILSAEHGWKAPCENKETDLQKPSVHCMAVIASGPELVVSQERRKELLRLFPEAIAIEMEGEGVFAACEDLGIEWAVIKGVSDYADDTKSKTANWKPFASVMAASVVNHIFSDPVVLKNWRRYSEITDTENQALTPPGSQSPPKPFVPLSAKKKAEEFFDEEDDCFCHSGLDDQYHYCVCDCECRCELTRRGLYKALKYYLTTRCVIK